MRETPTFENEFLTTYKIHLNPEKYEFELSASEQVDGTNNDNKLGKFSRRLKEVYENDKFFARFFISQHDKVFEVLENACISFKNLINKMIEAEIKAKEYLSDAEKTEKINVFHLCTDCYSAANNENRTFSIRYNGNANNVNNLINEAKEQFEKQIKTINVSNTK